VLRIIKNASWCSDARGVNKDRSVRLVIAGEQTLGGKGREAEQNVLPLNFLFLMLCNQLQQAFEIASDNDDDYISLTDMARSQLQEHIIFRWLSLKSTIEYLGEWEMLYNPNFNCTEFGTFRNMAGSNNFVLSVKTWIEKT